MISTWLQHELDIVETLTRRVRILSFDQIRDIWWPDSDTVKPVRRGLKRLRHAGLVQRASINAHPRLRPESPLQTWCPGQPNPDFRAVSQQARNRWTRDSIQTEVYTATRLAANLFASSALDVPPLLHRDHDLLMSDVFVAYRRDRPADAACWLGEDALPKAGYRVKDPDAFLVDRDGHIVQVVESTGRYDAGRIHSFHKHCVQLSLPYELW